MFTSSLVGLVKYQCICFSSHICFLVIVYFTYLRYFYTSVSWWFSTGVLGDSMSPQVSKTFLVNLNNAVVWMVSSRPLISKSSTVPVPILWWLYQLWQLQLVSPSLMFYIFFFLFFARSRYLSFLSLSFGFTLRSARTVKSTVRQVLFVLMTISRSNRLAEIRWSVSISESQKSLCVSFSRTHSRLWMF